LRSDGTIFYADISTACIEIGGGKYTIGFFRDVTKRKRTEKALRKSEEKYRSMMESFIDPLPMTSTIC
jgi:PAS domain-containing protein